MKMPLPTFQNLRLLPKSGVLFLALLFSKANPVLAQVGDSVSTQCKTSSLGIHSGLNSSAPTPSQVAVGANDPEWQIVYASPLVQAQLNLSLPMQAVRMATDPNGPYTPNNSLRSWISYSTSGAYAALNQDSTYTLIFRRKFYMCEADVVKFQVSVAMDDYIKSIKVNNVTVHTGSTLWNTANYMNMPASLSLSPASMNLSPGLYNIDVEVGNAPNSVNQLNPHSFLLEGSVSSTTGKNSIKQNGFSSCECTPSAIQDLNSDNASGAPQVGRLLQNTPNPFKYETLIRYEITEMKRFGTIVILDLNGKEVMNFPITSKGTGEITVSAHSFSSGTYLYRLVIDGRTIETKRMVVTK
jgi:hypothetical protein